MVMAKYKQGRKKENVNKKGKNRYDLKKLENELGRKKYEEGIENRIELRGANLLEIEEKWAYIKECIVKTAKEQMSSIQAKYKNNWWDHACNKAVNEKNFARNTQIRTRREKLLPCTQFIGRVFSNKRVSQ